MFWKNTCPVRSSRAGRRSYSIDQKRSIIDAAYIEANASLDKVQLKSVSEWSWQLEEGKLAELMGAAAIAKPVFTTLEVNANPTRPNRNNRTYWSPTDPEATGSFEIQ